MENSLINTFTPYIQRHIVDPIVKHISTKGCEVTVAELMEVLQLNHTPTVPSMAFGGGSSPSIGASVKPKGKKYATLERPVPGLCARVLKRGFNPGKCCGQPVEQGYNFCKKCLNTYPSLRNETGIDDTHTKGSLGPAGEAKSTDKDNKIQVNVNEYDPARGLYKEVTHGFIVQPAGEDDIRVVGKLLTEQNTIVALTAEEEKIAEQMGLTVVKPIDSSESNLETNQTNASIPQVNTNNSTVPSIPTVPSMPTVTSMPTMIPSIPTLNRNGLSQ